MASSCLGAALLLSSCAPQVAPPPVAASAPLPGGPLTDFVPSAGLRWMAVARLAELAHTPSLAAPLAMLFPAARLDAFARSSGVDLRTVPSGLAAGFDYATLFMAETPTENTQVETRFVERFVDGARSDSPRPGVHLVRGAIGATPETLVRLDGRFVAVSVGDPTPARIVELFALGKHLRSLPALRGAALSNLPADLESASIRFYAPGPFAGEWASGARGLFGNALAVIVAASPSAAGDTLRVEAVLVGAWLGEDAARLSSAWTDLAESSMGRLLGLDQPGSPAEVTVSPRFLTLTVEVATSPLASGLRAAVAADVWEILASPNRASDTNSKPPAKPPAGGASGAGGATN